MQVKDTVQARGGGCPALSALPALTRLHPLALNLISQEALLTWR